MDEDVNIPQDTLANTLGYVPKDDGSNSNGKTYMWGFISDSNYVDRYYTAYNKDGSLKTIAETKGYLTMSIAFFCPSLHFGQSFYYFFHIFPA